MLTIDYDAQIELRKERARRHNLTGQHDALQADIKWLEEHWGDDHAARAFYTELEQAFLDQKDPR